MNALEIAATLVRQFEGFRAVAYPDPASGGDPWTIGYGSTVVNGRKVQPGQTITMDEAEAALQDELVPSLATVDRNAPGLTDGQRAALASFVYNLGAGAFQTSTLLRLIVQGNLSEAADEFPKWCHAAGKVMPGLVKRRAMERSVFLGDVVP